MLQLVDYKNLPDRQLEVHDNGLLSIISGNTISNEALATLFLMFQH